MRGRLWWGGLGLLLLLAACGGADNDNESGSAQQTSTPAPTATATATPASVRALVGDPPASPETQRIEEIFAGVTLPPEVEVFGRRDIPNDAVEKDSPEAGVRFREYGRVTGNYYVLTVDGAQRMTLSISRYGSPDGAAREFEFGKGNPTPEDQLDAGDLGEQRSAHRSTLGAGGSNETSLYLISYTRGCYYVVVADFPPGGADSPPDSALALAQAVDDELKESEPGAGGAVGCS